MRSLILIKITMIIYVIYLCMDSFAVSKLNLLHDIRILIKIILVSMSLLLIIIHPFGIAYTMLLCVMIAWNSISLIYTFVSMYHNIKEGK